MKSSLCLAVGVVVLLTGCSGGTAKPTGPHTTGTIVTPLPADATTAQYGYAASPTGVDYQSDVVVVPDGGKAIRSESNDGLTYTLDPNAKGVKDLQVGKVLVETSQVTGRVVAIQDTSSGRAVTLGPVDLGEVVKNGTINLSQALDPSKVSYRVVPDQPGVQSTPTGDDVSGVHVQGASFHTGGTDASPFASKDQVTFPIGDWKVKPVYQASGLTLTITRNTSSLKVGAELGITTSGLRITGSQSASNGVTTGHGFRIDGITGLTIGLQTGIGADTLSNGKITFEVPVEVNFPVPPSPYTAGLPLDIKVQFKFSVETALTGKNSTLFATGAYSLTGPIGYDGGKLLTPKFAVKKSIIDSISGITLGPSGVVLAMKIKLLAGFGPPVFTAGPYGTFTEAIGIINGSSLGASLARCRGATVDLKVGAGAGIYIDPTVLTALKRLLPAKTKLEHTVEASTTFFHRTVVVPNVPLCTSGG